MTLLNTNERQHHNRPELYSEFWIDLYTEYDFFLIFRMKQSTFQNLLQIIMQQQEMQRAFTGGFESVLPQKIQQIAIYYLANQISMAQIGDKFNVASSTVFNLIQWSTMNQRINIQNKFKDIAGFPGITKYIALRFN
ncbi:PREDICTED: uncharacterized protein LOC108759099 [Trachymyrmex cornetzi]|uniref:uncharacterized protein LOC108759099 n=1 Tax=Trachymyrmex cornetzi TaxID=471704 RepID=UPI00084EF090|nr:PREDICTED: uncharacterized protein LOC108759099 [Trachymyrmex cornetzi]